MKKILIIEDEILIQQSLKILIEARGFNVEVCSSGTHAIECILKNDYFKIICDLMLQDITGFDILEESLKRYTREEIETKFIIMTAYNLPYILDKANKYNCTFIKKPFDNIQEIVDQMTK